MTSEKPSSTRGSMNREWKLVNATGGRIVRCSELNAVDRSSIKSLTSPLITKALDDLLVCCANNLELCAARTASLCRHIAGGVLRWNARIGMDNFFARSIQCFLVSASALVLSTTTDFWADR